MVTLAILALTVSSVGSQSFNTFITSSGAIQYPGPPEPPQPPSGEYYDTWESNYQVETNFLEYLSGSTFDFNGFFDNLYTKFLRELETTVFGAGYERPALDYGSPTYVAGEPILINGSTLESIADYVVYQDENGYVYYKDSSGTAYGGGDTIPDEINTAISLTPDNGIVFIKAGNYTVDSSSLISFSARSNLIIAGEGWNTTLRLADGVNWTPIRGTSGCQNIIVRDLMIDANMAGNPNVTYTYGIDFTGGTPRNILIENIEVANARRMGIVTREGNYIYFINNVVVNSGWNNMEHIRCSWGAAIGNYLQGHRDVGLSTWGSNNLVVANNIAVNPIHDGLGYNDANWGIAEETQGGGNFRDSYNIIFRNNIADEHNVAPASEPWRGSGLVVMGSSQTPAGSYNIIVDGNIMRNNNRAGLLVVADSKYASLDSTIVIVNNYASGNDVYGLGPPTYGNYVIYRNATLRDNVGE